ncbi:hypothetical protein NLX83_27240 [Allokutzneria sp. A3M-2-11 16]|uniref:hypothetical protein n=1 Tax=Allokutzneria sp. A3M-2-11 16 TaxID=2962043 RepID=UPI0020B726C8|nr:hypothetical protein [Allokutzneria sp. A3M-2-11 16]MCP3802974.1 hypothetical protein [Allokutzneria sp. A3M-2-11 16]
MAEFTWELQPRAEALVDELVDAAVLNSPRLSALARSLGARTSTRLQDWLDHIGGPVSDEQLIEVGYVEVLPDLWRHPGAQLPAIVPSDRRAVALRVDDAGVFAVAQGSAAGVQGSPRSGFRSAVVSGTDAVVIAGVERRSWACGVTPQEFDPGEVLRAAQAWRLLAERPRGFGGRDEVVAATELMAQVVKLVGSDLAASYFLELERQYWQRRNTAAVLQHSRQDRLGLGWGNNDHHTFRSGRACFDQVITLLTTLGFGVRERFYAGAEAGWGAQVLEHPGCGGVIFADVDLNPEDVDLDFAHVQLAEGGKLGTVGLWCALHGESILAAGMHHLEGQFDFDRLRDDLGVLGVGHMKPFSDFPHLRQAFTEAERWPVRQLRLAELVAAGQIGEETAEEFGRLGAAGSHLENLARRGGFKGFNQHNVSTTMRATDPRIYRPVNAGE